MNLWEQIDELEEENHRLDIALSTAQRMQMVHEEKARLYERRMAEAERADRHALFWLACGVIVGFVWTLAILGITRHIK